MGCPSEEFPRPWSIYRWISGEPASTGQVAEGHGPGQLVGAAAGVGARGPGPAAAAGHSGRHSSPSAREREARATRKTRPPVLSASSSPTTLARRGAEPTVDRTTV